jgi:hypothetical protein
MVMLKTLNGEGGKKPKQTNRINHNNSETCFNENNNEF